MGSDPFKGQLAQFVIQAGVWQAGHMIDGGRYALFGCTVAPGFTDDIFEGGTAEKLSALYPERVEEINRFCVRGDANMPEGFAS
jgi:predicted cupin superfamily sugar epimerase